MKRAITIFSALAISLSMAAQSSGITDPEIVIKREEMARKALIIQQQAKNEAIKEAATTVFEQKKAEFEEQIQALQNQQSNVANPKGNVANQPQALKNTVVPINPNQRQDLKKTEAPRQLTREEQAEHDDAYQSLLNVLRINRKNHGSSNGNLGSSYGRMSAKTDSDNPYEEKLDSVIYILPDRPNSSTTYKYNEQGDVINIYATGYDYYLDAVLPYREERYTYDTHHNVIQQHRYYIDNEGNYTLNYSYEATLGEDGYPKEAITYNTSNGELKPKYKYEYAYDANGNRTLYTRYSMSSAGEWVGSYSYTDKYDDKNRLLESCYYGYNEAKKCFYLINKSEYAYDDADNTTLDSYTSYNTDGSIYYAYKYEMTYNDCGLVIERDSYDYDTTTATYVKYSHFECSYAEGVNKDNYTGSYSDHATYLYYANWNAEENRWEYANRFENPAPNVTVYYEEWSLGVFNRKKEQTRNEDGSITTQEYFASVDEWIPSNKYITKHDDQGRLTLKIEYGYDGFPESKTETVYGENDKDYVKTYQKYISQSYNTYNVSRETKTFTEYGYDYFVENWSFTEGESGAWVPYEKTHSETKPNGDKDYEYMTYDNQLKQWIGVSKSVSRYDEKGRQVYYALYNGWDNERNDWMGNILTEKKYDEKDRVLLDAQYDSMYDGKWIGVYYNCYAYDEYDNKVYSEQYSGWNTSEGNDWIDGAKLEYKYDETGRQLMLRYSRYKNGEWITMQYATREYQKVFLIAAENYYNYNGELIGDYKYTYNRDEEGNILSYTYYIWNLDNHDWEESNIGTYNYKNGKLDNIVNTYPSVPDYYMTTTYTYDAKGRYDEIIQVNSKGIVLEHVVYNYEGEYEISLDSVFSEDGSMRYVEKRIFVNNDTHYHYEAYSMNAGSDVWEAYGSSIDELYDEQNREIGYKTLDKYDTQLQAYTSGYNYVSSYDEEGTRCQSTYKGTYNYDTNQLDWKLTEINYYNYDENNYRTVTGYLYDWDEDTQNWTSTYYQKRKYNDQGKTIEKHSYSWTGSEFYCYYKEYFDFDEWGNQTLFADSIFNIIEQKFYPDSYWKHIYDKNNNTLFYEHKLWSSNGYWTGDRKYEYTYNDNGQIASYTTYNTFKDNEWSVCYEYKYDENNNNMWQATYNYNYEKQCYQGNNATSYRYSQYGFIETEATYQWNYDKNTWMGISYYIYQESDEYGYSKSMIDAYWNNETDSWDYYYYEWKNEYDLTADVSKISGISNVKILRSDEYENGKLVLSSVYYYSPFGSNGDGIRDVISHSNSNAGVIYNLNGQRIIRQRDARISIIDGRKVLNK